MYALADCNNFFVSCERVFRPDLDGKPVIVLSSNDGCAVARSNEAKALGIPMGAPLFKIKDIVKANNVQVFSSNFALYGDMSRRVQEVLRTYSPCVEQYSIDEAFLDLRGMEGIDFQAYAREISAMCRKLTRIPVSVGIAPTKTLAKIASKLCKQYPKLQGGCFMYRPQDVEKVLRKYPVGDVWGIGRRSQKKLQNMGIQTAWDYVQIPEEAVRKLFALPGYRTLKELKGIPCIEFEDMVEPKQSICVSRSFAKEITDSATLCEQVANFADSAASKLRKQGSLALEMYVFVMTNRFKENAPQANAGICIPFPDATADYRTVILAAIDGCRRIFRPGFGYKKAGVIFSKLIQAEDFTRSIFEDEDAALKEAKLSGAIDSINRSFGEGSVLFGSQGDGKIKVANEHSSPHYTTLWTDIPSVKI